MQPGPVEDTKHVCEEGRRAVLCLQKIQTVLNKLTHQHFKNGIHRSLNDSAILILNWFSDEDITLIVFISTVMLKDSRSTSRKE